jgi:hypothetical protein
MLPPTVVPTWAMMASAPASAIAGLIRRRDIDDGEEVHLAGESDHLEFLLDAHAGFLEDLAELAVHDAVGGEIVHAAEAHLLDLAEPVPHAASRVGGVHPADHRDLLDHGQDFEFADLHRDGVGVAVGHQPQVEPCPLMRNGPSYR